MPVSVLGTLSVAVEKYWDCYKIELLDKNTTYTIGHGSSWDPIISASKQWNSGVLQPLSSR